MAESFQIPADNPAADLLRALANEVNSLRASVDALTLYSMVQNEVICNATGNSGDSVRASIFEKIRRLDIPGPTHEAAMIKLASLCGRRGAEIIPFPDVIKSIQD